MTAKTTRDKTTREQRDGHEAARAVAARQGYIAWRMNDVPAVYQNLMPYSFQAPELWEAEQAIRAQLAEDVKLLQEPWRRLGPACQLLDYEDMTGVEKVRFALEVSIPHGMEDQPKRGGPFNPFRSDKDPATVQGEGGGEDKGDGKTAGEEEAAGQ